MSKITWDVKVTYTNRELHQKLKREGFYRPAWMKLLDKWLEQL